jgi:O-antigen/teichoic acid export membrane protein
LVNISSTVLAVVLLLTTKAGIMAMPFSLLCFYSINYFLLKGKAKKKCSTLFQAHFNNNNKLIRKQILSFSIITTLGGLAWTIESTSDVFILNSTGLFSLVALYVIWWRFPQMLFDLATRLTTSSFPSLTTSHGKSAIESRILFNKLFLIMVGFALLIGVGIAVWLPSFIDLWVGSKFHYSNYKILSILAGLIIANRIIGNCFSMFLMSTGKTKINSGFSWIQAIVKVTVGLILTKLYGIEGLFFTSLCASAIQVFGLLFFLLKEKRFLANINLLVILPILMIALVYFYDSPVKLTIFNFALGVLLSGIIIFFLYLLFLFLFKIPKKLGLSLSTLIGR